MQNYYQNESKFNGIYSRNNLSKIMDGEYKGTATGGTRGVCPALLQFRNQNKVQKFQFQSPVVLLFIDVQKLTDHKFNDFYRVCYNFFGDLWRLFIFSSYVGETDHFMLGLLKRSDI